MISVKPVIIVCLLAAIKSNCQAPPSIDQVLRDNGISTSQQSLIENLHNKNVQIRGLAAMQLAVEGDVSVLQYIREALSSEKVGPAQLNMARALKTLGDKGGVEAMTSICVNPGTSADIRLMAAQEIPLNESSKCVKKIIEHLAVSNNTVEIYGSLLFLANRIDAVQAPSEEMDHLTQVLDRGLVSTIPSIRQESAVCVGKFRVTSLRAKVQEIETRESDAGAKQAMQTTILLLKQ